MSTLDAEDVGMWAQHELIKKDAELIKKDAEIERLQAALEDAARTLDRMGATIHGQDARAAIKETPGRKMSDIAVRLRLMPWPTRAVCSEAADEIERLRVDGQKRIEENDRILVANERLRAALREIIELELEYGDKMPTQVEEVARNALEPTPERGMSDIVETFNWDTIYNEAEQRYTKYRRRAGGQAVTEKDGIEYWCALVAHERATPGRTG